MSRVVAFTRDQKPLQILNGISLVPWPSPSEVTGWSNVSGQREDLHLPAIKIKPHKKPAAGAVAIEPDGAVWVVEPANHFGGYVHTFPKGKLEAGLSDQATAIKEAFEESGLKVRVVDWLGDYERDTSITRYFLCEREGGDPTAFHWETQAVKLVPSDQIKTVVTHKNDQPIVEALLKHLQRN